MPKLTALLLLAAIPALACSCSNRHSPPPAALLIETTPAHGSADAPRDVLIRATFDRDLDPVNCTPANCKVEGPHGEVPVSVSCSPSPRVLAIKPHVPLDRRARYRVTLGHGLGSVGSTIQTGLVWEFETDAEPAWHPAVRLGDGDLLALEPGRDRVFVAWDAPGTGFQIVEGRSGNWGSPVALPGQTTTVAAIAEDSTGRLAVALSRGQPFGIQELRLTVGYGLEELPAPQRLGPTAHPPHLDVAASACGHIVMGWSGEMGPAVMSRWPGILITGEQQAHWLGGHPHVFLTPAGDGHVVAGLVRYYLDPLGGLTPLDPQPPTTGDHPLSEGTYLPSEVVQLREGEFVAAHTTRRIGSVFEHRTRVHQAAPGQPWHLTPAMIGGETAGHFGFTADLAANSESVILAGIDALAGTITLWERDTTGQWSPDDVLASARPALDGVVAAALTESGTPIVAWASSTDTSLTAPASLVATRRGPLGWNEAHELHGLAAFDESLVVRAITAGPDRVIVAWSRHGEVWAATLQ